MKKKNMLKLHFPPCLKQCNHEETPPFAELSGKILKGAGKETLLRIIKEEIKNVVR